MINGMTLMGLSFLIYTMEQTTPPEHNNTKVQMWQWILKQLKCTKCNTNARWNYSFWFQRRKVIQCGKIMPNILPWKICTWPFVPLNNGCRGSWSTTNSVLLVSPPSQVFSLWSSPIHLLKDILFSSCIWRCYWEVWDQPNSCSFVAVLLALSGFF